VKSSILRNNANSFRVYIVYCVMARGPHYYNIDPEHCATFGRVVHKVTRVWHGGVFDFRGPVSTIYTSVHKQCKKKLTKSVKYFDMSITQNRIVLFLFVVINNDTYDAFGSSSRTIVFPVSFRTIIISSTCSSASSRGNFYFSRRAN